MDSGNQYKDAEAVHAYKARKIGRREFLSRMAAAGISVGLANSLSLVFSNDVFANSTKDVPAPTGGFDYIVLGAGSSGATVAAKLAQLSDATVLVLEAGGTDQLPEIQNPLFWTKTLGLSFVKHFPTTHQAHANRRVIDWPRAYALGGNSDVNAMIFARGHRHDFDSWAAAGCTGWDFASVLKAYKALEDWEGGASELRGAGGPLRVTQPAPGLRHPGAAAFIQSAVDLGHPANPDFNGERMEGPAWVNMTISGGTRQSTGLAFLKPAMARKNLTVLTDAPATQLVMEGTRCVGVKYLHNGQPTVIRANREVVVSAGSIESPKLLLLSGIGPEQDLKRVGITPKVALPGVGQNLQDHILGAGVNYEAKEPVPVSHYNHSEVYMWARTDSKQPTPNINTLYVSLPFSTPELNVKAKNGYSILSGVMQPTSRGTIALKSGDFRDRPIINPNYLSTKSDVDAFMHATELAREIGAGNAFSDIRKGELLPGPRVKSRDDMHQFLRQSCSTFFHPTSTCKMGTDETAVVDPALRVHGVQGLRVVDASIMPNITTGNTNAPAIMIGWRAAEIILAQA
ncbi:GMC family oxidoreductase [Trinickia mobilis]|uniref:GMC family oxidoreductase n=1 Tax=Trinickia mobilis TaxID=2816356 RepID=UPI001A90C00F|nr:GMC family oxidoreductase N-terminal domain-containing protein [Trinickia mobilis]